MREKFWKAWCYVVTELLSFTLRKSRPLPSTSLIVAFSLALLFEGTQPLPKDQLVDAVATSIAEAGATEIVQNGSPVTVGLSLPPFVSTTRMHEAELFAEKLVAGFGLKHLVAVEFADWILEAAARQQLEPELVASLVFAESSFRKNARSHVGAVGPAQVRPNYWSEFCGAVDLHDPEQNIYCGAQILGFLLDRCNGNQACALSAYNIGMNSKRFAAGLRYVDKIDRHMATLKTVSL
jgi:hypothetical protein